MYCNENRYYVMSDNHRYYGAITTNLKEAKEWLANAESEFPNEVWKIFWFMD